MKRSLSSIIAGRTLMLALCISLFMPLQIFSKEQIPATRNKNLDKAASLWQQAMTYADNDNETNLVKCCKSIILLLEPSDSLYEMSRNVLAELAYDHENMSEIYRHYAYFNYLKNKNNSDRYEELCSRLKFRYDSLLNEDRRKPITDGIYAAVLETTKYGPYLIMQISHYGNNWRGKVLGGEARYEDKTVKKSKADQAQQILQAPDEGEGNAPEFSVMWNKFSRRDPNVSLSKSLLTASNDFGRNMAGELNSGRYKTGDVVTGTIVTGAVQGLAIGLAALLARGSSKYYNTELVWTPHNGGALDARIIMSKVSQNTTQSDAREETSDMPLKLFKIYPHTEAFFIDDKSKSVYFADEVTSQNPQKDLNLAWQLSTHPLIFNTEIAPLLGIDGTIDLKRLKKNKSLSHLMFRLFIRNGVFQHMFTDPVAKRMTPFGQCITGYSYNQVIYRGRDGTGVQAILDRDGTEIYECFSEEEDGIDYVNAYSDKGYRFISQGPSNSSHRKAEINFENGYTYSGEVSFRNMDGRGILKSPEGQIWEGLFDSNYFARGNHIINTENSIVTVKYENFEPDTIATVNFHNGDLYVGPVNSEKQPNGNGIFTAKGKKPKESKWVDGKIVIEKRSSKSKKKKSRRHTSTSKTAKK